jgi:hypothetical protein
MKIQKTVPYYLKRALPVLGFAGATLTTSCEKEPEPTRDVEFTISLNTLNEDLQKMTYSSLEKECSQPDVRYVYITAKGSWKPCYDELIHNFRVMQLEPRLAVSPKIRGRGNFDFELGEASKVHEDSLWYVNHGWTINAQTKSEKQR